MGPVTNIKRYHLRPDKLRHEFEDEYAHLIRRPDMERVAPSTLAPPLYTLVDRRAKEQSRGSWR